MTTNKITTLSVRILEKDLDRLQRIAKEQDRRFSDFIQLVFGDGLPSSAMNM